MLHFQKEFLGFLLRSEERHLHSLTSNPEPPVLAIGLSLSCWMFRITSSYSKRTTDALSRGSPDSCRYLRIEQQRRRAYSRRRDVQIRRTCVLDYPLGCLEPYFLRFTTDSQCAEQHVPCKRHSCLVCFCVRVADHSDCVPDRSVVKHLAVADSPCSLDSLHSLVQHGENHGILRQLPLSLQAMFFVHQYPNGYCACNGSFHVVKKRIPVCRLCPLTINSCRDCSIEIGYLSQSVRM